MATMLPLLWLWLLLLVGQIATSNGIDEKKNQQIRRIEKLVRERFESSFNSSCSRYPFVDKYWRNLASPSDQYVEFIFGDASAPRGYCGGMGDRFAGIINAAAIAIRLQRTLIVTDDSPSAFAKYFRPYQLQASDNNINAPRLYSNANAWARFKTPFKNDIELASNPHVSGMSTLYLKYCMNPEFHPIFVSRTRNSITDCGLELASGKSIYQRVIRIKSNRCYLCKWWRNSYSPAHAQLRAMIGSHRENNIDMFNVAGCLLRLAAWPTDYAFRKMAESLLPVLKGWNHLKQREKMPVGKAGNVLLDYHSEAIKQDLYSVVSRNGQYRGLQMPPSGLPHGSINIDHDDSLPLTIGLHFRCGDQFLNANSSECETVIGRHYTKETPHMGEGTPIEIGSCANSVAQTYNQLSQKLGQSIGGSAPDLLIHIASDNIRSEIQMKQFAGQNLHPEQLYLPPAGCHIALNSSVDCQEQAMISWLLLTLSDVFVIPMFRQGTASAFSRYAMIYALSGNVLFHPKSCRREDTRSMSLSEQGNWICSNALLMEQKDFHGTNYDKDPLVLSHYVHPEVIPGPDNMSPVMSHILAPIMPEDFNEESSLWARHWAQYISLAALFGLIIWTGRRNVTNPGDSDSIVTIMQGMYRKQFGSPRGSPRRAN
jgi:hypothetical protein